jgi:hypothetical protein
MSPRWIDRNLVVPVPLEPIARILNLSSEVQLVLSCSGDDQWSQVPTSPGNSISEPLISPRVVFIRYGVIHVGDSGSGNARTPAPMSRDLSALATISNLDAVQRLHRCQFGIQWGGILTNYGGVENEDGSMIGGDEAEGTGGTLILSSGLTANGVPAMFGSILKMTKTSLEIMHRGSF